MNWKIIVGVVLIAATAKECFTIASDFRAGVTAFPPLYGFIWCLPFFWLGFYLIKKGRVKPPFS